MDIQFLHPGQELRGVLGMFGDPTKLRLVIRKLRDCGRDF